MSQPVTMTIRPQGHADLSAIRRKVQDLKDAKDKVRQYRRTLSQWEQYQKGLEREIAAAMGASGRGLIDGREAVTYEAKDQFAHARFLKDHPDLAQLYMVPAPVSMELDWRALVEREPEIAGPYQTRIMTVLD